MKLGWVLLIVAAAAFAPSAFAQVTSTSSSGATSGSTSTAVTAPVNNGSSTATSGSTSSAGSNATNAGNSQSAATTVNNNYDTPATQTIKSAPAAPPPALTTTLTDTCMGSTSVGVSVVGMGATGGTTWNDGECVRRLNARELNNMGFHTEACLLLRVDKDVEAAFQRSGNHCDNWTPPQASNAQQPPQQPQAKEAAPRPPNPTAQPSTPPPQASAAAQAAPQAPTGFLAQNGAAYGSPSTPVPYYQLPAYEAQAEATPASSGSPPQ